MISFQKFEGLVAASFTPMNPDGSINAGLIPEYYSFLERNGINAVFINGTTGEGPSLTQKEKQLIASEWAGCMKARDGSIRVINLTGGTSYKECIENAVCSRDLGLPAIAVQSPYYFKPDETRLAEFVTMVGETVPEIPVYYYHIPDLTGVCLSMSGFLTKITGMLSSFAGIKYSGTDLGDYMSCLYFANGRYDILWGRDECLLAALATGAKGAVGSSYNYLAPLYLRLIDEFRKGNISRARSFQYRAVKLLTVLQSYGGFVAGKAMMKYLGLDCGKFRLPLKNMNESDYDVFAGEIRNLGMEEYFSKL